MRYGACVRPPSLCATVSAYNDADQLTSDGPNTFTYAANGNLVPRGAHTFAWDYGSRMTGATMGSTTATYTYDGEDVCVGKKGICGQDFLNCVQSNPVRHEPICEFGLAETTGRRSR
jgi:hypothetical protein